MENPTAEPGVGEAGANTDAYEIELTEAAMLLLGVQKTYGQQVRDKTVAARGRLAEADLLVKGVLGAALLRGHAAVFPVTATSEERSALFASYVVGLSVCENAIAEGRYLQAGALLRQEMETLAQIKEVAAGTRRGHGAPNVAALEGSIRRLYGDLSAAAHLSKHDLVRAVTGFIVSDENMPGPTSGTRYFPQFDAGMAHRLFGLHLMLTIYVILELSVDLHERIGPGAFTERDAQALDRAMRIMEEEGVLEIGTS